MSRGVKLWLIVSLVVFVVMACKPALSKWETWRQANVPYQWNNECRGLDGQVKTGFYNAIDGKVCLSRSAIDYTTAWATREGRPDVARAFFTWLINHEAAHKLDSKLGFIISTHDCFSYGAGRCPFAVMSRGWERGAECIVQRLRPDLNFVRDFIYPGHDAYWKCPQGWLDFYTPYLRFAGVL